MSAMDATEEANMLLYFGGNLCRVNPRVQVHRFRGG
jgi:hypothetical protein